MAGVVPTSLKYMNKRKKGGETVDTQDVSANFNLLTTNFAQTYFFAAPNSKVSKEFIFLSMFALCANSTTLQEKLIGHVPTFWNHFRRIYPSATYPIFQEQGNDYVRGISSIDINNLLGHPQWESTNVKTARQYLEDFRGRELNISDEELQQAETEIEQMKIGKKSRPEPRVSAALNPSVNTPSSSYFSPTILPFQPTSAFNSIVPGQLEFNQVKKDELLKSLMTINIKISTFETNLQKNLSELRSDILNILNSVASSSTTILNSVASSLTTPQDE